jgi:hypothetical protein
MANKSPNHRFMKRIFVLLVAVTAFLASPAHSMEYREGFSGGNCSTCSWIAIEGEISEGAVQELIDFITANDLDYQKLIVINSLGGNVSAALELGSFIRERNMKVIVGHTKDFEPEGAGRVFQSYDEGVCASACVFVLMGGEVREVADEESRVGVHQFAPQADEMGSVATTTASTQNVIAFLQSYSARMGVDPAILTLASSTSADEMRWLNVKTMEQLNLLTSRNQIKKANWSLEPFDSSLMATATQQQPNGRKIVLYAGCDFLLIAFEILSSDRIAEVAASLQSAELALDDSPWTHPLTIDDVSAGKNMVLVSFKTSPNILSIIAQANNHLKIDLDLAPFFMGEYWGWEFNIPTSNIAELVPHISKACE